MEPAFKSDFKLLKAWEPAKYLLRNLKKNIQFLSQKVIKNTIHVFELNEQRLV